MKFTPQQLVFIILSVIFLFGFKSIDRKTNSAPKAHSFAKDSLVTSDFNEQWRQKINSGAQDLGKLYTENAVKVHLDGKLLEGQDKIQEYYNAHPHQIKSISSIKSITAVLDSTIVYEIGRFTTSDQKEFSHLILWREENGMLLRELELVASIEKIEDLEAKMDKQRADWMTLCNAHNAKDLVTKLYTENALYYNHRPMIIGQEAIIGEYGYMNNPDYQLTLSPMVFESVNESLAFEIGQCSGSYPGNYVLVWQKNISGEWRIFFDSNI